ncbi:nucleolar protein 11-like isoform X3 [Hippocampus comes]|uniref:Nucleolar protein 11 n=1 Tax=Hippocampus comes TaxID=109280 RepID=A0A3Q2Z709_HIPCM|nr:PREDICTED: nucleolar protein 11 isoform X1 [Hippocampus comes]XP_019732125.1 PREDICTED: nucleolar protein 11 isoform X2 [Hippocampus comes]XP_019732126.1 PREDICTED: nucleolar protein 11 isoform X3 [Hippocampus comes]
MAALYEGYTLCGIVPSQNLTNSSIQGVEEERDSDHVIVTDAFRSVTLYKVSDQKPLGSWTVKQGNCLTCPAVYNTHTKEYVTVTDNKVIRIWKEDDVLLDKTFKATVLSDIWRVHCVAGGDPVVLFQRGAVRLLDSLLSAPQQTVEEVLAPDETIRWSTNIVAGTQQLVIFTTEMKGDNFLYLQKLKPNILHKYRLEQENSSLSPLSFSASYRDKLIHLLYLYPNGHVYQSVISVLGPGAEEGSQTLSLPRNLLLALSVDEDQLNAASALLLDEAHVAVVGVPHPSAGTSKDFLCIWNINFQTLQAGKEIAGKIFGQLWCYSNKLFIPHGKTLSVIPYGCTNSSLASALGKLKQYRNEESKPLVSVPSWNSILHEEKTQPSRAIETRKLRSTHKSQSSPSLTVEQVLELIKTAPVEEVQKGVEGLFSRTDIQDLNQSVGPLASTLVSRSLADTAFYSPITLAQLVHTHSLCHSVCPDLVQLALEKKDYFLCQLCLQFFPDIPEAVTCTCLKAFISMPDSEAEKVNLEPDSLSFMETLTSREHCQVGLRNGFNSTSSLEDHSDVTMTKADEENRKSTAPGESCPVGLQKAVLLNEILQTAYTDDLLLPHLKDLSSQHVFLFLQYLHFLYLKYNEDAFPQSHGYRSPSVSQIMDWVCLLLDAHFTVLVMTPEAKVLLLNFHSFIKSQVRLFSELGKVEGGLQALQHMKRKQDIGQYSIEIIELF